MRLFQGCHQKTDQFHGDMYHYFVTKFSSKDFPAREVSALATKFKEISSKCSKFTAAWKMAAAVIEQQSKSSGTTSWDQSILATAHNSYLQSEGEHFAFYKCWLLLRDQPKWSTDFTNSLNQRKTLKFAAPKSWLSSSKISVFDEEAFTTPNHKCDSSGNAGPAHSVRGSGNAFTSPNCTQQAQSSKNSCFHEGSSETPNQKSDSSTAGLSEYALTTSNQKSDSPGRLQRNQGPPSSLDTGDTAITQPYLGLQAALTGGCNLLNNQHWQQQQWQQPQWQQQQWQQPYWQSQWQQHQQWQQQQHQWHQQQQWQQQQQQLSQWQQPQPQGQQPHLRHEQQLIPSQHQQHQQHLQKVMCLVIKIIAYSRHLIKCMRRRRKNMRRA
jgi:hypothetical protein